MRAHRLLIPLCVFAALAIGCSDSDRIDDATLRVINQSDFVITDIYLTEIDNPDWGPNLLRGDVLLPGEELLLGVRCDFYDALLIDEDGVECEIFNIDLCLNDARWVIRNNTCAVFEKKAREMGLAVPETATEASPEI
jgi:hypothetical protein